VARHNDHDTSSEPTAPVPGRTGRLRPRVQWLLGDQRHESLEAIARRAIQQLLASDERKAAR
jgi:hypothetical protein